MRMRRVSPIVIAAQESIVMKPGGYHLMLIDLKQPLKDGEKFTVQIGLKDGQTTSVDFVVSQARLLEALKSRTHSAHEH
jgi:copper(I)-binding protein